MKDTIGYHDAWESLQSPQSVRVLEWPSFQKQRELRRSLLLMRDQCVIGSPPPPKKTTTFIFLCRIIHTCPRFLLLRVGVGGKPFPKTSKQGQTQQCDILTARFPFPRIVIYSFGQRQSQYNEERIELFI
jgi:hypothetical protein